MKHFTSSWNPAVSRMKYNLLTLYTHFRDGMDGNIVGSWNSELSQLCLLIGWIIYKWEEIESKLVSNFGGKWKGMSRVNYSIISNADT